MGHLSFHRRERNYKSKNKNKSGESNFGFTALFWSKTHFFAKITHYYTKNI